MNPKDYFLSDGPAPMEPSSDIRGYANDLRQIFTALTLEGFTESQALQIIGVMIHSFFGKSQQ